MLCFLGNGDEDDGQYNDQDNDDQNEAVFMLVSINVFIKSTSVKLTTPPEFPAVILYTTFTVWSGWVQLVHDTTLLSGSVGHLPSLCGFSLGIHDACIESCFCDRAVQQTQPESLSKRSHKYISFKNNDWKNAEKWSNGR